MIRQGNLPPGSPAVRRKGSRWVLRASGAVERYEPYTCNTVDFLNQPFGVKSAHKTIPNLWVDTVTADDDVLGLTEFEVMYLGVINSSVQPPVYTLRGSKTSQPLDTHVNFANMVLSAGSGPGQTIYDPDPLNPDGPGIWKGFGKLSNNKSLIGQTTFDDTALIWSVEFVSTSRRNDLIGLLQTICTPLGNYPKFVNRNWILSDLGEREIGIGSFYEYNVLYECSSPGGHQPLVYSASAQSLNYPRPT